MHITIRTKVSTPAYIGKVWAVLLLCISCPSATQFLAILFFLLSQSSSNTLQSFQHFRRTLVPNFIQIRQRVKNFPIYPHCNVAESRQYLQWVSMGKFFNCCRIYCAFHVLVQPNFGRYHFYFLPDQAQTHFDHFNVLDELWCQMSFKSDNG